MQNIYPIPTGNEGEEENRRLKLFLHQSPPLKCPRCDSINTKFCYYNNYNFSQPRHFCKTCRRYWTSGGSLRNVPVGGGSRKPKNSKLVKPPPLRRKSSLTSPIPDPEFNFPVTASSAAASQAQNYAADFPGISSEEVGVFTNERDKFPFLLGYAQGTAPPPMNLSQGEMEQLPAVVEKDIGEDMRMRGISIGFSDPTPEREILEYNRRSSAMGFGLPEWRNGENYQGLVEFPGTVDQALWFKFYGLTTPFTD